MGDTYDFVFSNREKAILKNKIEVMSDYCFVIKKEENNEKFLFVATLAEDDIETDEPFGVKFAAIRVIEQNLKNTKETVLRKFSQAHGKLDEKLSKQVDGLSKLSQNLGGFKDDLHTRDAKLLSGADGASSEQTKK